MNGVGRPEGQPPSPRTVFRGPAAVESQALLTIHTQPRAAPTSVHDRWERDEGGVSGSLGRPDGLGAKLLLYGAVAGRPQYCAGNAALLVGYFGQGLMNSAYLHLLEVLGTRGGALPVVGVMATTALQMVMVGSSLTYANHRRDNEDMRLYRQADASASPYSLCMSLLRCGVVDAIEGGIYLGVAIGFGFSVVSPDVVLATGIVAKAVEACNMSVAQGFWNCLKVHWDDPRSRMRHRMISRTIVGIETVTQALAFNVASIGGYLLGSRLIADPERRLGACVVPLMAAGLCIACLSKIPFWTLRHTGERTDLACPDNSRRNSSVEPQSNF